MQNEIDVGRIYFNESGHLVQIKSYDKIYDFYDGEMIKSKEIFWFHPTGVACGNITNSEFDLVREHSSFHDLVAQCIQFDSLWKLN